MRCSKGMKFLVPLLVLLLVACGGPEEKKLKFFKKGNALYDKRDYVSATLEFKNAIQIDPNYTEAFYMLGMSELRLGDGNKAFRDFSKAIELDPKYLKAHIELGQLFLGSRMYLKSNTLKGALDLDFVPKGLDRMGSSSLFLLRNGVAGEQPAQVLDTAAQKVFFVPVGLAVSGGE